MRWLLIATTPNNLSVYRECRVASARPSVRVLGKTRLRSTSRPSEQRLARVYADWYVPAMNADPSRAGAGGEDNSWETLAEDLFGIDLGADPSREPLVVPEDLALDEPESSTPEVKAAPEKPAPAPAPSASKHEGAAASSEKRPAHEEKRPQR